jgi:hypothetical protein
MISLVIKAQRPNVRPKSRVPKCIRSLLGPVYITTRGINLLVACSLRNQEPLRITRFIIVYTLASIELYKTHNYTKFHKDRFRHSKVDKGNIQTQTAW